MASGAVQVDVTEADPAPWADIALIAQSFVTQESPPGVLPFSRDLGDYPASDSPTVLIHYVPFFELSFDNRTLTSDHWAELVAINGLDGRFAKVGGFARERPLTPEPWSSPYWREINAAIDILRAQLIGADGFGLDIPEIGSGRHADQVHFLIQATVAVAPGFKIALEPGMVALGDVSAADLAAELIFLASSPAVDRLPDGRLLVVPFAAERKPISFWTDVIQRLRNAGDRVGFLPDFLDLFDGNEELHEISYGETFWGTRDPVLANSPFLKRAECISRADVPIWMVPVAPQDVRPKSASFAEASNTKLFRTLWMQAIETSAQFVHILTWNDYGESTEVQPSSGTQFLFYDLCAYYLAWFKAKVRPTIMYDALYYSHRTEIYSDGERGQARASPFRLTGRTPITNDIEMVAFLTRSSTIEIEQAGHKVSMLAVGFTILRAPARLGRPTFRIYRGGRIVVEKVSDWAINANQAASNPVYFGGSSTRLFMRSQTASE